MEVLDSTLVKEYKNIVVPMLSRNFPMLNVKEVNDAVDWGIKQDFRNSDASLYNNYKDIRIQSSLLEMTEYILSRKPIITPSGCLFQKHAEVENPFAILIDTFIQNRVKHKKEMFKYPKGSVNFEKYNLLQLLDKIDANGLYGAAGMYSCIYYNIHVASSITAQGRSAIAASILAFEAFLADNVKFNSLDEIIMFIHNIIGETNIRKYDDRIILDGNVTVEEVLYRLFINCDYSYVPNERDMGIVWDILVSLSQTDLNRIFYKNNLYSFVDNQFPTNALIYLLQRLDWPYLDPNEVPDEIDVELKEFWELLKEYVYYGYQYLDRIPRVEQMYRSSAVIIDTDSAIVSLDAWYRFVLKKVVDVPMKIKEEVIDPVSYIKADEFGDRPLFKVVEFVDPPTEYDFLSDEIIELERTINPMTIIPQDGLRFSILNILAYCLGNMINDCMERYTMHTNSYSPDRKCLLKLKNEFTFRRALVMPDAKKHYSSTQDLQEGNRIPENKALDIKGLELDKSGLQESTRERLKSIMYEEILKADNVSQIAIVKQLAKFEKEIFLSIEAGSKQYFKPVKIRAAYAYDDPMRIQGVKGSYVYNALKNPNDEGIDLEIKNSVDIAKVNMSIKTADKIKNTFPEVYERLVDLLSQKDFVKGITSITLPINAAVPQWIKPFIDYDSIVSDNIKPFPLDVVGVTTTKNGMYTNMIKL